MRRIGVLLPAAADDADFQAWVGAFQQALVQSGWIIGRNVRIDTRWAGANADDIRRHAAELVALGPEVILAYGTSTVRPLLQTTRTVPIVFPVIADPVGAGLVDKPGTAGWQRHRIYDRGVQLQWEVAGAPQGRSRRA
jgi:putative ABC transport system substrate-binding protein